MSIPSWIIIIGIIAFLIYLLLEMFVGVRALLDLFDRKENKEEGEDEPPDTPLAPFECIGLEAQVSEKLSPYGKIKIQNHEYEAMSISGEILSGSVQVYKNGRHHLLVTKKLKS